MKVGGKKRQNGLVLVSAAMLTEIETVLQTQVNSSARLIN